MKLSFMKTNQENLVRAGSRCSQAVSYKRCLFLVAAKYFTLRVNNEYYICCILYKYVYGIIGVTTTMRHIVYKMAVCLLILGHYIIREPSMGPVPRMNRIFLLFFYVSKDVY